MIGFGPQPFNHIPYMSHQQESFRPKSPGLGLGVCACCQRKNAFLKGLHFASSSDIGLSVAALEILGFCLNLRCVLMEYQPIAEASVDQMSVPLAARHQPTTHLSLSATFLPLICHSFATLQNCLIFGAKLSATSHLVCQLRFHSRL